MSDSILNSIKEALDVDVDDDSFDSTLVMHINTYLSHLAQLGVGPELGFRITDTSATWDQFYDTALLDSVRSYVVLRVRNLFDPLPTGFGQQSMDRQIAEMEFRILSEVDV